jgi:Helix-hairpin-helix containing domain
VLVRGSSLILERVTFANPETGYTIAVVRSEPYRLAADVWGIGFKTADTIAAAVGIARTARSGSRPAWPIPCPGRPTTATAACPRPT